jgi:2-(1,2-epoxy-1,2-dihydrophenyl)acetyl-CoA isomerase
VTVTDDLVLLDLDAGVATLTLNRPERGNAIDHPLAACLRRRAESLVGREGVRAVVLRGAGKAFSVGGDVRYFASTGAALGDELRPLAGDLHIALEHLAELDAPVLAAVHGVAAGAGMSMVLGADLAIAGRSAFFSMAYTAIGLSPDGGSTWYLPRLVGVRRAAEIMLLNPRFSAERAAELGLVNRVVDDEALDAEVSELARRLAEGPTLAYGETKRLLARSLASGRADQLAAETAAIARMGATPDAQEGVAAFAEKRPPRFGGR